MREFIIGGPPVVCMHCLTWDVEGDHCSGVTVYVHSKTLVRQSQLLGVLRSTKTERQLTEMIVFLNDGPALYIVTRRSGSGRWLVRRRWLLLLLLLGRRRGLLRWAWWIFTVLSRFLVSLSQLLLVCYIYIDRVWVEGICCNYTDTGTCVAVACKSANIMNLEICRQFGPELLSSYRPGVLSSLRNFLCSSSNTFSPSFLNAISSSDSSGLHT